MRARNRNNTTSSDVSSQFRRQNSPRSQQAGIRELSIENRKEVLIRKKPSVEPLKPLKHPSVARVRYTERVVPLPTRIRREKRETESSDSIMFINQVDLPITEVLATSPNRSPPQRKSFQLKMEKKGSATVITNQGSAFIPY
jgi:hypothetical protein